MIYIYVSIHARRGIWSDFWELSLTQPGCQSRGLSDSCNSSSNDCGTVCMPPVSALPTGRDTVQLCTSPAGAQACNKLSRHVEIHSTISNSKAFMCLNSKPTSNKCTQKHLLRALFLFIMSLSLGTLGYRPDIFNSCTAITLNKIAGHLIGLGLTQTHISNLSLTLAETTFSDLYTKSKLKATW